MNDKLKATLPVGATEASVLRYNLAQELAQLCPPTLGEEIALTGSASHGWSDHTSDIEINFWAQRIPSAEEQLTWLHEIGATDIFPNVETAPDGSVMTTFTRRGIIVEAQWQTLAQQEQVLQTLLAAQSYNQWLILNGEMISSALPLRSNGVLTHWQQMVADYPDALVAQVIASATEGWSFRHWLDLRWAYIERNEHFIQHRSQITDLNAALTILWAINRRWGPQWKWISHTLPTLNIKPPHLEERIATLLTMPPPQAVVTRLELILEILALVPPQFDVSKPVSNIRASLQANT